MLGEHRVHLGGGKGGAAGFGIKCPGDDDGVQDLLSFLNGTVALPGAVVKQVEQVDVPGIVVEGGEKLVADVHPARLAGKAGAVIKKPAAVEKGQFLRGEGCGSGRGGGVQQIKQGIHRAGGEGGQMVVVVFDLVVMEVAVQIVPVEIDVLHKVAAIFCLEQVYTGWVVGT